MKPGELELHTTEELINELLCRTTFQGVIVHTSDEAKSRSWDGERVFKVRLNGNLEVEEAGRLLDVVSQYIARTASE
ncbi:hypothetical protein V5E97_22805 [Singulisphaera sp. Ch08]|uniref:Uncharacterized protein n=1 Tax=Singulisphaera sp. Ch08 TaxID=3120278 RepID=A0AAU7C833_9BACT